MNGFSLLAQAPTVWNAASGSSDLYIRIAVVLLVGFGLLFAMLQAPPQSRKWLVGGFTFVSGLFYFLLWIWPQAQDRKPNDIPQGFSEQVSFWLTDATGVFGKISNILVAILLLLGVASLIRIHVLKLAKQQKDWGYSVVLLVSLFGIAAVGYYSWLTELRIAVENPKQLEQYAQMAPEQWPLYKQLQDFMFDGLLQAMDAAMFSIIAFYILSAAYRAFRIRSVEATILLASAFLVMLSLLGMAELYWNGAINMMTGDNGGSFLNNFKLTEIAGFIRQTFQQPGLRAIDFGIGVGALAMGLRLWLGLEKSGGAS